MRLSASVLVSLAAFGAAQSPSLQAALSNNTNLSLLSGLISSNPSLLSSLSSASNITVLAPSNAGLQSLLNSTAGVALGSNPGAVQALLQYHVLNGSYPASTFNSTSRFIRTLLTNSSYTNVTNGQRVQAVVASNKTTFYSGLLANTTVQQSLNFTGGVIHVLSSPLTLPLRASVTLLDAGLTSLYGALTLAGLANTVDSLQDATIFAPNNAAFQAIGSALTNATASTLGPILNEHLIVGNGTSPYYSSRLVNGSSVTTAGGKNITFYNVNGTWFVNNAKILTSDILVAGGVVHVIDEVLNPNNATAPAANATGGKPAYSASSVSAAPFTSGVPSASTTIGARPSGVGSAGGSGGASSTSSKAGAMAMPTGYGVVGAVAPLVGAAALLVGL
jgi:uncharacterized surface protein with fasciclin (FAS1) repeats